MLRWIRGSLGHLLFLFAVLPLRRARQTLLGGRNFQEGSGQAHFPGLTALRRNVVGLYRVAARVNALFTHRNLIAASLVRI
jgi:hypothetical protein